MEETLNISHSLQAVFLAAEQSVQDFGIKYIGSEHLVLAMLNHPECTAYKILAGCNVLEQQFKEYTKRTADKNCNVNGYTPRTKRMIEDAVACGGTIMRTEHLLLAIVNYSDCLAMQVLRALGIDIYKLRYDTELVVNMGVEQ